MFSNFTFFFSWNNGENHIIFNMVRNNEFLTSVNFGKALLLASGLDTFSYRPFFDIALPMYSPSILDDNFSEHSYSTRYFLNNIDIEQLLKLKKKCVKS